MRAYLPERYSTNIWTLQTTSSAREARKRRKKRKGKRVLTEIMSTANLKSLLDEKIGLLRFNKK